jgi:hypothetical protein
MAWIKRNLYFVIIMAVGLILTGVGGYFVYATISANADARDQYTSALNDLTQLQQKKPYPSPENIKVAKEDSERVAQLVKDLGNAFVNFPPPPVLDPREFIDYLNTNLNHFRMEATNANVALISPDYAFSFSAEANTLSFSETSFGPWMEQLEEIKAIVDILCNAKINALDSLQRAPAPGEDSSTSSADYLPTTVTSNQVAIISPYKIAFRGFSEEIAKVLKGFAESGHCFLIKDLEVSPSKAVPVGEAMPSPGMQAQPMYIPRPRMGGGGGERRGRRGGGIPMPQPEMQPEMIMVAPPTQPTGPVTVLKPMPLFVTMVIDVVKLKNPQR